MFRKHHVLATILFSLLAMVLLIVPLSANTANTSTPNPWSMLTPEPDDAQLNLPWQVNLPLMLGYFPTQPPLNLYSTTDIPTLDPQVAEDAASINNIENLFVNLTNFDIETTEIVPEAAIHWWVSQDGRTYTFRLRTDIPWVKHHPITGETTQETDELGNPRYLTAHDFVYGIKRSCDPNLRSYYSSIIAPLIVGCAEVLNYSDPGNVPQWMIDAIGVEAPNDATLVIHLNHPAGYFLSMTTMWTLAATPQWAIEANGDRWTEAGIIVTNGPYVLHEWVHDVRRTLMRNPLMPKDMRGKGNIPEIVTNVVSDSSAGYALWMKNEVDISSIPDGEMEKHLSQYQRETIRVPDLAVFYFGFRTTKAPFNDPRVRRAFSAAFDREKFIRDVRHGGGLPMKHFAPPGIFGAPLIDEVGVGYNSTFAREQLAAAGYPDCQDFPTVTLLGYSGQSTKDWIEFAQQQWLEHLGCGPDKIHLEQVPFRELLMRTSANTPDSQAPHMWTLGWGPDYPDENNWVGDVLWCGNPGNRMKRACTHTDALIVEAREDRSPQRRIELYRQIENAFFGANGEMPIAPLYTRASYIAQHAWLTAPRALFGGEHYYDWNIDALAKYYATH